MTLSYGEVADILNMVEKSSCEEFVLETSDIKLTVRRGSGIAFKQTQNPSESKNFAAEKPNKIEPQKSQPSSAPMAEVDNNTVLMRSPMIATFYSRPSPDAPVFVQEGDNVKVGQSLFILEVMKLFTEINSEVDGTVSKILVSDGDLVEFDQPILEITKL